MITNSVNFIAGMVIIGYMTPEILVAFTKAKVPLTFNIMSAIAFGLIASSFV